MPHAETVRPPVLVVGDSMLDRYWEGSVDRISPEAPVPVLRMGREWQRAGGAANLAVNLAALGCPTTLATLIGSDEPGRQLQSLLHEAGIVLHAVAFPGLATTQKIRAVCRRQQLLRVDIEEPAPADSARALADCVIDLLPASRWLLLSDYAKGSLAEAPRLIQRAHARGLATLVDPKGADFSRYAGAWLLKPNEDEALRITGPAHDEADFCARMQRLREASRVEHLLVTRGERGMALFSALREPLLVPGLRREVFDVSGAGDTALAALAAALSAGQALDEAVRRANRAAALVVGKFGTATISATELDQLERTCT